jgi:hypothetical protein
MSWIPPTTFPPALTEVLGVTLTIFSPTKELRLAPHFELDWKIFKAGINPERVPMSELPIIVQDLNVNLSRAILSSLNPEH